MTSDTHQAPNVPDMREFEPRAAALALREYRGMGADRVGNVVHWLEAKGVRVLSLKEQSARMDAFSLWLRTASISSRWCFSTR